MELTLLVVGVMVAGALAYLGFELKNANRIAMIRLEFDRWNAPWSEERKKEFADYVSSVLKQTR
ncbi:hypothetical protein [Burkholderia stagnalis]|uniref:hypothetical protein n=1 Tax=Burkholderia stagnalis TaxID=1503054 RepID=UPI000AB52285|nr:hypothetical protein [Burkholderia stagnalis]